MEPFFFIAVLYDYVLTVLGFVYLFSFVKLLGSFFLSFFSHFVQKFGVSHLLSVCLLINARSASIFPRCLAICARSGDVSSDGLVGSEDWPQPNRNEFLLPRRSHPLSSGSGMQFLLSAAIFISF